MNPSPPNSKRVIEFICPEQNWTVTIKNFNFDISYLFGKNVWNRQPGTKPRFNIPTFGAHCRPPGDPRVCTPYEEDPEKILTIIHSVRHNATYAALGEHIKHSAADKLCDIIFSTKSIRSDYISNFYNAFFPAYVKREYSWATVHLLKKAYAARPATFKKTFSKWLYKTDKVPRIVLLDFVANLNKKQRNEFMNVVVGEEYLSSEEFIHNLSTLNLLFYDSEKNPEMCYYVAVHLLKYMSDCYSNRDYGRLLYTLVKNLEGSEVNPHTIRMLADSHGTEFKAICLSVLDSMPVEAIPDNGLMDRHMLHRQQPPEENRAF